MALYENPFVNLTAFTLSMWVQTDTTNNVHTPFSYATVTVSDELYITVQPDKMEFWLHKRKGPSPITCMSTIKMDQQKWFYYLYHFLHSDGISSFIYFNEIPFVLDDQFHHICVTWTNVDGKFSFYLDGISKSQGTRRSGHVIQKGTVVLGQMQSSYKGGFERVQSHQGKLTSVNMWDKVLTPNEVTTIANKCSTAQGNVIKWSDFQNKISGNAKMIYSRFCDGKLP
ncbi:neuronal pentraxin-1-like [Actinia tenebrosa]|uniref:Neuronal pentraxin-1-like n=1 Tax=Actinia tenebrosa TaxID=6105 RepID=A0A6P8H521_ACTTE|nr:neuronal pentraxin-1-like [Actinia tenebrosa]